MHDLLRQIVALEILHVVAVLSVRVPLVVMCDRLPRYLDL